MGGGGVGLEIENKLETLHFSNREHINKILPLILFL